MQSLYEQVNAQNEEDKCKVLNEKLVKLKVELKQKDELIQQLQQQVASKQIEQKQQETEKLYMSDTYIFEYDGVTIVQVNEDERGAYLILDKTIFHPQGGGQPSDVGTIKYNEYNISINHVRADEKGLIRHYYDDSEGMPNIEPNVACSLSIDEKVRIGNATLHTAGHFLCHVVELLYPSVLKGIKGFHFATGPNVEFKVTAGTDFEKASFLEKTNKKIQELLSNDPIDVSIDIEKLKQEKVFRTIRIGDFPQEPCGGTHLNSTKGLEKLQATKIKVKKGIAKVSYVV